MLWVQYLNDCTTRGCTHGTGILTNPSVHSPEMLKSSFLVRVNSHAGILYANMHYLIRQCLATATILT
jgi:hypothetical protein